MKKLIIISIISFIAMVSSIVSAQTVYDAMLFSRHYAGGTARSMGMSGAFGALGGDASVLSTNPAGLAVFRGSEFTFTPALNFVSTDAKYDNNIFSDNSARFILNNVGYIYTKNMYNEKGLKSVNFGFAYNRLSDFNYRAYIKTQNAKSSLLDEFVLFANDAFDYGHELHPFYEELAWYTNAIFIPEDMYEVVNDYILEDRYDQYLHRTMNYKGGIGEYDFSIGLNFNHNLYIGATIGIQDIQFSEYYYHEETPTGFEYLKDFNFRNDYSVSGLGVNLKTGIIYRPIPMLRLGVAIHTPTYLRMKPYLLTGMETNWHKSPEDGYTYFYEETENDPTEKHNIKTPWQYIFSAATVIGKLGALNVDVELIDFSQNLVSPQSEYDNINNDISTDLKTVVNVKTGAEVRLGAIYLRGGMAFYGNPFNEFDNDDIDDTLKNTLKGTISYSGGIGFRKRDFYMDAAYSYMEHPERIHLLYELPNAPETTTLQTKSNKILVTFGFRF